MAAYFSVSFLAQMDTKTRYTVFYTAVKIFLQTYALRLSLQGDQEINIAPLKHSLASIRQFQVSKLFESQFFDTIESQRKQTLVSYESAILRVLECCLKEFKHYVSSSTAAKNDGQNRTATIKGC